MMSTPRRSPVVATWALFAVLALLAVPAVQSAGGEAADATTSGHTIVHVTAGRLADGQWVGTYSSQLQANVVDRLFGNVTEADCNAHSMVNSSRLRYLVLSGAYLADGALRLPSLFVLQMQPDAILTPAANITTHNVTEFSGLVEMRDTHFTAVVGGTIDASSLPAWADDYPYSRGWQAVCIKGGSNNAVRGLRARSNNTDTVIGVTSSAHTEVANCDVGGGPGGQGQTRGRCIWTLATSSAIIHDNWIRNCSSHSLDFDAYTSASAAYNNVLEDHGEEGIFVEETAHGNFIFNNTVRRSGSGIGVYSNAVGPVADNMIIANTLEGNYGCAITAGGVGHNPEKTSKGNIFAGNAAIDNAGHDGGQYDIHHGATLGDLWIGNTAVGPAATYTVSPQNATEVVVFDPAPLDPSARHDVLPSGLGSGAPWAVFTAEEVSQCGRIRIPELTRTPSRILLFAQCRFANQSGSAGLRGAMDDMTHAKVISKASRDGGRTWGDFTVHTPLKYSHGAAIYDRVAKQVVLQFQHHPTADPELNSTYYQRISADDGVTWGATRDITDQLDGCNPFRPVEMEVESAGSKIQTSSGRLLYTGHSKHNDSCTWYSDDHGATYRSSNRFSGNEVSVAELAPGRLYMNGRGGNHTWNPNRTQYLSTDDGATWGPARPSALTDNNNFGCEAAVIAVNMSVHGRERAVLFFSEPTGAKRTHLTLRCSLDGGETWPGSLVVGGDNSAAYSAMVHLRTPTAELAAPHGTSGQAAATTAGQHDILVVWETGHTMVAQTVGTEWCLPRGT